MKTLIHNLTKTIAWLKAECGTALNRELDSFARDYHNSIMSQPQRFSQRALLM